MAAEDFLWVVFVNPTVRLLYLSGFFFHLLSFIYLYAVLGFTRDVFSCGVRVSK